MRSHRPAYESTYVHGYRVTVSLDHLTTYLRRWRWTVYATTTGPGQRHGLQALVARGWAFTNRGAHRAARRHATHAARRPTP